jgi:heme-binding protein
MRISGMTMRRGIVGVAAAGALAGLTGAVAMPTASADADCTVSGLSNAIGAVGAQTGQWFAGHPDANKAVTEAGTSGNAEGAIRNYFVAHQSEWAELQSIAQPLRSLRQQCGSNVAPGDIARLFDAMAS